MNALLPFLLVLSSHAAESPTPSPTTAPAPGSVPAVYFYQELQPGFRLETTLKSNHPCPENRFPVVLSEEWVKKVTVKAPRKGKNVTLRDRNILLRTECEGTRPSMKLVFEVVNDSGQYDHVHLTLLDGLAIDTASSTKLKGTR